MTKRPTVTYKAFDVVVVPFPFTDSSRKKRRPALVLSSSPTFNEKAGHSVMAMITSARNSPWPLDVRIGELKRAGLSADSVVRMKLFTLDHRFVLKTIGTLGDEDRRSVGRSMASLLTDINIPPAS